jgi:hypothetical protein
LDFMGSCNEKDIVTWLGRVAMAISEEIAELFGPKVRGPNGPGYC